MGGAMVEGVEEQLYLGSLWGSRTQLGTCQLSGLLQLGCPAIFPAISVLSLPGCHKNNGQKFPRRAPSV